MTYRHYFLGTLDSSWWYIVIEGIEFFSSDSCGTIMNISYMGAGRLACMKKFSESFGYQDSMFGKLDFNRVGSFCIQYGFIL